MTLIATIVAITLVFTSSVHLETWWPDLFVLAIFPNGLANLNRSWLVHLLLLLRQYWYHCALYSRYAFSKESRSSCTVKLRGKLKVECQSAVKRQVKSGMSSQQWNYVQLIPEASQLTAEFESIQKSFVFNKLRDDQNYGDNARCQSMFSCFSFSNVGKSKWQWKRWQRYSWVCCMQHLPCSI